MKARSTKSSSRSRAESGPTSAWLSGRSSPPTTMRRGPRPASSTMAGRLLVTTVTSVALDEQARQLQAGAAGVQVDARLRLDQLARPGRRCAASPRRAWRPWPRSAPRWAARPRPRRRRGRAAARRAPPARRGPGGWWPWRRPAPRAAPPRARRGASARSGAGAPVAQARRPRRSQGFAQNRSWNAAIRARTSRLCQPDQGHPTTVPLGPSEWSTTCVPSVA